MIKTHRKLISYEELQADKERLEARVRELEEALRDYLNESSGRRKLCPHNYDCICVSDRAKELLKEVKPNEHTS